MGRSENYWKYSIHGVVVGLVLTLLGIIGYSLYSSEISADTKRLPKDLLRATIAITCPCDQFFEFESDENAELKMITAAFKLIGRDVQYIYASYQDALRYFENKNVQGILAYSYMHKRFNHYYLSSPLATSKFVAVTLAKKEIAIEKQADLEKFKVGIHPDTVEVLDSQLIDVLKNSESVQKIANNLLLASLLFTGEIDVLITEKSIFTTSVRSMSADANPSQQVKYQPLFDSVSPKILFANKELRDRFNEAWKKLVEAERK